MNPSRAETDRRILTLVHAALIASVGVYAVILWLLGASLRPPGPPLRRAPEWAVALFAVAQYVAVTAFSRRILVSPRRPAAERVRGCFLVRMAAAEAIGVFGLLLGFTGSGAGWVAGLFLLSFLALGLSTPSREAWAGALRAAGGGPGRKSRD